MQSASVHIKDIKANPNNPRIVKDDKFKKLVKSIQDFPQMLQLRPIVVNEDMIVLGGNMRLKACREAGLKEVPIIRASSLTEEQQREFIIKDNVGYGEWDWDMIANEWDAEQITEWGLDIPDFKPEVLDAEEDDYEIPDTITTDIVLGDLFEIGQHKLLCGSSLELDSWERLCGNERFDLVVTDPPYNVALGVETVEQAKARNRRTDGKVIKNDKMSDEDFYQFLYDFYTSLGSYTKAGGAWYVWHADSEVVNFRKAMTDAGLLVKQGLIWKKNALVMGRQDYQWIHEPCLYGWKEGAAHGWYSDRKQTTILEFDRPTKNPEHPTMKPIPLIAYQITNSSKQGDLVGDGFLGSGTTMLAAHQIGRKCYGTELDPQYCQVIVDRMLKLDPSLEVKRNGQPYIKTEKQQ